MLDSWALAAPIEQRKLSDEHLAYLTKDSGISPDVVAERGYYTLDERMVAMLVQLEVHYPTILKATGWLGIPIIRPDGVKHGEVIRLFGSDAPTKYVWPTGTRQAVDVHPRTMQYRTDRSVPVIITEGIKKADAIVTACEREGIPALVLAVNGCWGWRSRIDGGSIAIQDFHDISWDDRKVYVVSDSDYRSNNDVAAGWNACATYLSSKTGEHRTFLVVVPPAGLEKVGADDFLAGGGTLADLLGLAQTPKQAVLDMDLDRPPLLVKSAREVIRSAGQDIPHLVTPIVPERSILVIAGHSGTYKTWHALSMALDGAFGLDWLGHPTLKAKEGFFRTLYVNKEMGDIMLGQRLKTMARNPRYMQHPDYETVIDERIFVTDEAELALNEEKHRDRLEAAIVNHEVQLVVLDSMSMSWHGEENNAAEVGEFMSQLRGIIERTGVVVGIVHHLVKSPQKNVPLKFAVRGSGQIIQQADAVLVLDRKEETAQSDIDDREIEVLHAKSRTSLELPTFISRFTSNDGMYHSLSYVANAADFKAKAVISSGGDPAKLSSWIMEEMLTMPSMGPEGSGLRQTALIKLLRQAWPEDSEPPSDYVIRSRLSKMTEEGTLTVLESDRKNGNLMRLPTLEGTDEQ